MPPIQCIACKGSWGNYADATYNVSKLLLEAHQNSDKPASERYTAHLAQLDALVPKPDKA